MYARKASGYTQQLTRCTVCLRTLPGTSAKKHRMATGAGCTLYTVRYREKGRERERESKRELSREGLGSRSSVPLL